MRAIVISEKRFQELFDRLTDTIELQKYRTKSRHESIEDYHRLVHYQLHSFMNAVREDKPWCPDYMLPKTKQQ